MNTADNELLNYQIAEWETEIRRLADLLAAATEGRVLYTRSPEPAPAKARARGRMGGRKPVSDDTIARIRELATTPDTIVKDACKSLGISRATFYKYALPAGGQVSHSTDPATTRRR